MTASVASITDAAPHGPREQRRLVPALEGIRGVSVFAVLLFHGQVLHATGGFLGVSVFFTLSGYLITTLAIAEMRATSTFSWKGFAARRARRLLPVSSVGIALAIVVTLVIDDAVQMTRMRGDAVASLLQVANWRFLFQGQDYAAIFAAPSAFLHYWSLAIEEQFYWVFAIVLAVVARRRRPRPLAIAAWAGAGWLLAGLLQVSGLLSGKAVYYSTFTRAGEILAGVALAGLMASGTWNQRLAGPGQRRAAVAGVVGGVVVVVSVFTISDPTGWITRGGLALFPFASCAVVLAGLARANPVVSVCSLAPVRWVGKISYALYVVHWPIFLLIDDDRLDIPPLALFAVRVAVSMLVAWLSLVTIEAWSRRGRTSTAVSVVVSTAAVAVLAIGAGSVVVSARDPGAESFAEAEDELEAPPVSLVLDPRAARLVTVGDSTALRTSVGLSEALAKQGLIYPGGGDVELGCGLNRVVRSQRGGETRDVPERCDWTARYRDLVASTNAKVVVVQFGPWETEEQQVVDGAPYEHLGDPGFDAFALGEMEALLRTLTAKGAKVVWLDIPVAGDEAFETALAGVDPDVYEERRERYSELLDELADRHADQVVVVHTDEWLEERRNDQTLRPDGMHLSEDGSKTMAREWLAAEVAAALQQLGVTS